MKGFLGCCYQCDVPPETIQNLRICLSDKSVVFAHYYLNSSVQLQLEKFFCFFLGGPARAPHNVFFWVGPPGLPIVAASQQACQENYFYFLFDFWD